MMNRRPEGPRSPPRMAQRVEDQGYRPKGGYNVGSIFRGAPPVPPHVAPPLAAPRGLGPPPHYYEAESPPVAPRPPPRRPHIPGAAAASGPALVSPPRELLLSQSPPTTSFHPSVPDRLNNHILISLPFSERKMTASELLQFDYQGPTQESSIDELPRKNDIVCVDEDVSSVATGNTWYQSLVDCNKALFHSTSTRAEKKFICEAVVAAVHLLNPPSRFLEKWANGRWYILEQQQALCKTWDALLQSGPTFTKDRLPCKERSKEASTPPPTAADAPPLSNNKQGPSHSPTPPTADTPQKKELAHGGLDVTPPPPPPKQGVETSSALFGETPGPHDVLCGRGCEKKRHPGNQQFRALVLRYRHKYASASTRKDKTKITYSILNELQRQGVRFLDRNPANSYVVLNESRAYQKVSQALRDCKRDVEIESGPAKPLSPPNKPLKDALPPTTAAASDQVLVLPFDNKKVSLRALLSRELKEWKGPKMPIAPVVCDVLCGMEEPCPHAGNVWYRAVIQNNKHLFYAAKTIEEKKEICHAIVVAVRVEHFGRFLKERYGKWYFVETQQQLCMTWDAFVQQGSYPTGARSQAGAPPLSFRESIPPYSQIVAHQTAPPVSSKGTSPDSYKVIASQAAPPPIPFKEPIPPCYQVAARQAAPSICSKERIPDSYKVIASQTAAPPIGSKETTSPDSNQVTASQEAQTDCSFLNKTVPRLDDVIVGRGVKANNHPGNVWFRTLIRSYKDLYLISGKKTKIKISETIFDQVKNADRRFMEKESNGEWYEVDRDKAYNKISMSLRQKDKKERNTSIRAAFKTKF